ncbi:hypothetical protein F8S13_01705 [Chloroflexia bacterium SDU3-3]|nr:hypothetical protein F8S13_01705 [Chloroflexia bacterium SDU3-3]
MRLHRIGISALAVLLLALSTSYAQAADPGAASRQGLLLTATPTPTTTPTPTVSPPLVSVSVVSSAPTVAVGSTLIVTATTNLGLPKYQLYVIDVDTGTVQSQSDPLLTPAQPGPISVNFGAVSWTLTAVRAGQVKFTVSATGEICAYRPGQGYFCNWAGGGATSSTVTVTASTPAPSEAPSSSAYLPTRSR